ncbi:ATP-binding protein [Sphingomonas sp. DT-51]|uniref:ATP-binding protein n=1 Tax=Sphingomonas sp. DT-51 TaxID=3396165 RepID=UPI003F1CC9B5
MIPYEGSDCAGSASRDESGDDRMDGRQVRTDVSRTSALVEAPHGVSRLDDESVQLTANAVPALISFFDAEHVCRYANDHHLTWYGRSPESLVGVHMRDFLGTEAYLERMPFLRRVAEGQQVSFEAKVPHRLGGWREAAIRYVPRMGPEGFEGFHTLVFDLSREQHRFHSVFDGTAVAFWEVDLSDMRAMLSGLSTEPKQLAQLASTDLSIVRRALDLTPVLDLNAKAGGMFGVDRSSAIGRPLGDWVPDAGLAAWNRNLIAYLSGAESFEAETVMRRQDGSLIDVMLSCAFPKQPEEQVIVIVGIVDISARISKEQELARVQAHLAHAARVATLGELMASIAHEVNQPLAAVLANGNAAVRWLRRNEPDIAEALAALSRMISEGARASEVIARTRRMATKSEETRAPLSIEEMIDDAVDITRRQVSSLGASLGVHYDPDLPEIVGDRIQLQQVVINLIVNAAQAMAGQEGRRSIHVRVTRSIGWLVVDVSDSGPGLSADMCERVFDAFFSTKADGMGMGLSISKSIVRAHGGTITVRSVPGDGTRFRIELPAGQGVDDPARRPACDLRTA